MNRANKKRAEKELKAAQKLFNAASYSQAAEICHNQIQTYPDFLPARELLAEIFFTLGKPHEASATMVDLAVKNPEDIELQSKTGRTLQRAKLFNDAVEFFQNAVTKSSYQFSKMGGLDRLHVRCDRTGIPPNRKCVSGSLYPSRNIRKKRPSVLSGRPAALCSGWRPFFLRQVWKMQQSYVSSAPCKRHRSSPKHISAGLRTDCAIRLMRTLLPTLKSTQMHHWRFLLPDE